MSAPRRDLLLALAPAALCALLLAGADPRGDFPLNDDFQYADSVFGLLRGEGLRLSPMAYASQVPHILLGAVPARLFGAGDWVLRLWTMALGCAGAGATALLARRFGAPAGAAVLAGAVLACDPLHLAMSASFHLEITLLLFVTAAAWLFLEHLETRSYPVLWGAGLALGAAVLTRQTALLAAAGMAAVLARRGRLGRREAAALLLPPAALAAAWWAWFQFVHGPTWAALSVRPAWPLGAPALLAAVRRLGDAAQTAALLLAPVSLAGLPALRALPRPGRGESAVLALLLLCVFDGWMRGGMPLMTNTVSRIGLGVVTIGGASAKAAGWWGSAGLWRAADAAAALSLLALARLLWPRPSACERDGRARALCLLAAGPVLASAVLGENYDRYLLAWLPCAAAAAVLSCGAGCRPPWGLAAALAMGLASTAGLRDYFAWNRARWEAGLRAVERGVPPAKVANGFDWDGRLTLAPNFARLLAERPAAEVGMWDWMALNRIVAVTSFSPSPPRPDFVPVDSVAYRTPLARGERRVYLYGLGAASR